METIFDIAAKSDNKLLAACCDSIKAFKKHPPKNKEGLEAVLAANIVEIEYKAGEDNHTCRMICKSNKRFVNVYSSKTLAETRKAMKVNGSLGMKTNSSIHVMTYDLIENHPSYIPLNSWKIYKWHILSLVNENVAPVLSKLIHDFIAATAKSKTRMMQKSSSSDKYFR